MYTKTTFKFYTGKYLALCPSLREAFELIRQFFNVWNCIKMTIKSLLCPPEIPPLDSHSFEF